MYKLNCNDEVQRHGGSVRRALLETQWFNPYRGDGLGDVPLTLSCQLFGVDDDH